MIHGLKDLVRKISRKSSDLNQHRPETGRVSNVKLELLTIKMTDHLVHRADG